MLQSPQFAGAGQALLLQSMRWMDRADRQPGRVPMPPVGEVRMVMKRREARLLATLLKRHVARLGQPPTWMQELVASLIQIDEFGKIFLGQVRVRIEVDGIRNMSLAVWVV